MWRLRGNNITPEQPAMSVLDQGCEIEGHLAFSGTLVLNGKFQGELVSSDTLIVGEDGDLKADIRVGDDPPLPHHPYNMARRGSCPRGAGDL